MNIHHHAPGNPAVALFPIFSYHRSAPRHWPRNLSPRVCGSYNFAPFSRNFYLRCARQLRMGLLEVTLDGPFDSMTALWRPARGAITQGSCVGIRELSTTRIPVLSLKAVWYPLFFLGQNVWPRCNKDFLSRECTPGFSLRKLPSGAHLSIFLSAFF